MSGVIRALAKIYIHSGHMQEAEGLLLHYGKNFEKHYGNNNIEYAHFAYALGDFYVLKGEFDKAKEFLNKALKIFEKYKHICRYMCFESFGELYKTKKDERREKIYFKKAFNLIASKFPDNSAHVARLHSKFKHCDQKQLKFSYVYF